MDFISLAKRDTDRGVAKGAQDAQTQAFTKWSDFTTRCKLDIFLRGHTAEEQNNIIGGFAHRVRNNEFGKKTLVQLRGQTISTTIGYVAAAFRQEGYANPR